MQVILLESSSKHIKSLCMNHPYDLCDTYGHYSHHCPKLIQFVDALNVVHQSDSYVKENQTLVIKDLSLKRESFL
jgi:hypothetical protein